MLSNQGYHHRCWGIGPIIWWNMDVVGDRTLLHQDVSKARITSSQEKQGFIPTITPQYCPLLKSNELQGPTLISIFNASPRVLAKAMFWG